MNRKPVRYSQLNSKQKEIYNFQKVAACLADYGYNCIKLADDWQGADFLAYHYQGQETLKVQLKGRLTIDKKYVGKGLYIAFPYNDCWYMVDHDGLVEFLTTNTNYTNTSSWIDKGGYSSGKPNKVTLGWLSQYCLNK